MPSMLLPPPLSVYVHVPWCVRKCPYCDFNSHERRGEIPELDYVAALLADLEQDLPEVWGRRIETVFIGGGTPSLLSAEALARLLSGLRSRLNLLPGVEITLEANPGTVEAGRFRDYRDAGINRLSLGVQTFHDAMLEAIGRIHDGAAAIAAFETARNAGFDNINLDLMFALPGQSEALAHRDVEQAIALGPEHLSYYQLTLEPNTLFFSQPPSGLPDGEAAWRIQEHALAAIADAGYHRYEVSAFARDPYRCRHNLNYWSFGDYLGVGAGAHGKLTLAMTGEIVRTAKQRQPAAYLRDAGGAKRVISRRALQRDDLVVEFLLNALRLADGFDLPLFFARTGLAVTEIHGQLETLCDEGLLSMRGERVAPTATGYRFLDEILTRFP